MEENKRIELELGKLVIATYNRIATWRNSDFDGPKQEGDALKIVSQEIVQNALEELLKSLNVKTNTEVTRGDVKVGDIKAIADPESFNEVNDEDIFNKLFSK